MHNERMYNLPANTKVDLPVYGNVVVGVDGLAVTIGQSGSQKYWARVSGECYTPEGNAVGIGSKGFQVNSSFENMMRRLATLKR